MAENINTAIIERLEKVVESLQDNSVKMGQLLAVHNEKLIKKGCERDIRKVDDRLRMMEKKMWSIAGGLTIVSFLVSPIGQRFIRPLTEQPNTANMVHSVSLVDVDRQSVRI